MHAVSKIPSKCSFSPPLTLVSAVLSASGHPQKYVAIGPAQCRHRPAGGQPFRDVAARTAGAEHPTSVFVGCGACKIVPLKVQSDSLANSAQSTALAKYTGRVLKACCAIYAQRASAHYKGPLDHLFIVRYTCYMHSSKTISSLGCVSLMSRPRHILLHQTRYQGLVLGLWWQTFL